MLLEISSVLSVKIARKRIFASSASGRARCFFPVPGSRKSFWVWWVYGNRWVNFCKSRSKLVNSAGGVIGYGSAPGMSPSMAVCSCITALFQFYLSNYQHIFSPDQITLRTVQTGDGCPGGIVFRLHQLALFKYLFLPKGAIAIG